MMEKQIFQQRKKKAVKIVKILKKLFPKAKITLNYSNNWELLAAVMLSAQCTDKKVNEVTETLFMKYKTLNDYAKASQKEFEKDIKSTGFYRNKAKNIIASAKIIKEKYHGRVPRTIEEITELPGVARKTANIVLGNAYGIIEGVAVDTHVRRLSILLGLTNNTDPNKIERDLMQILPRKEWLDFSCRLIEYGRRYCPAKPHNHAACPLASIKIPR